MTSGIDAHTRQSIDGRRVRVQQAALAGGVGVMATLVPHRQQLCYHFGDEATPIIVLNPESLLWR
jgi:hypothetical protein